MEKNKRKSTKRGLVTALIAIGTCVALFFGLNYLVKSPATVLVGWAKLDRLDPVILDYFEQHLWPYFEGMDCGQCENHPLETPRDKATHCTHCDGVSQEPFETYKRTLDILSPGGTTTTPA